MTTAPTVTAPTVVLGRRFAIRPPGVAAIKPMEVIRFVLQVLANQPTFANLVKVRVDHDDGRPRRLGVEVLLAAAVAQAVTGQSTMHVRAVAALLRALDVGDQRVLGVRWTDPHGRGEQRITERQVEYLFGQIAAAFDFDRTRHNHLFAIDNDVFDPQGAAVGLIDDLPADERPALDCDPTCPRALSMERLGNMLLAACWAEAGLPDSPVWALDSSVIETHFATKSWGKVANIDPAWVADDAKTNVTLDYTGTTPKKSTRKGKDTTGIRVSTAKQVSASLRQSRVAPSSETGPADPKSRRIPRIGPTVAGKDFSVYHQDFPQLAPDGRLAHTRDAGARNGFVGAGNSRPSGIRNGRDKHALVASGHLPDGSPFPPFTRAYRCSPAGDNKGDAALSVFDHAAATGTTPGAVTLDRIYTTLKPEVMERVANAAGWTLVRDLKSVQRLIKQTAAGVHYLDGWWFTDGIQPGLLDLPRPRMKATKAERKVIQARYDERRPFTFRLNGTTTAGNLRLRGPAVADHVTRNAAGQVTAVRGVRVRCPNSPYFTLLPRTVPSTSCTKGAACGCSRTLTIARAEIPNSCERLLWGTTAWATEYYRRNLSEAAFSVDQYTHGLNRHSIRVRYHKWDLAHLLVAIATFVRMLHSWVMRLGAHSLDTAYQSGLDTEVIAACLARALTPARPALARPGAPPGQ